MALPYQFRPMSAADLPMVRRWLEAPHVAQWWHDPDTQFALVSGDLDHPAMDQFIVTTDERPFAYLQCYRNADYPEWGNVIEVNDGVGVVPAFSVDTFNK